MDSLAAVWIQSYNAFFVEFNDILKNIESCT